jgi:hypothetical protein
VFYAVLRRELGWGFGGLVAFGKGPRRAWEEGGQLVFLGTFVGWGFVSGYGGLKLYNL